MFIRSENEIISLMPTARWNRPDQLKGYLEEEERVALEPLLGTPLYEFLCREYERLTEMYVDITATTVKPTGKARKEPGVPYADVTDRMNAIQSGVVPCDTTGILADDDVDVPERDMATIGLLRICQQIEFYRMLSHKAGLLTVSFNEGGGMNVITADGYDGADEKAKDRVVKDAFMSAGRATDSLLLFLEADAKGKRFFTDMWQDADAFWLHKDLLFQTARVLNEYLDIKSERMAYVELVRDIRFCQRTYLMPRIGSKLLRAVVEYANGTLPDTRNSDSSSSSSGDVPPAYDGAVYGELLDYLRTALAFYVESRRTTLTHATLTSSSRSTSANYMKDDRLARRDSMTDAQQAMAMACEYVEDNLDALGDAAKDSPIYKKVKAAEAQAEQDAAHADAARRRQFRAACEQSRRKLFTAFPATHRTPELK